MWAILVSPRHVQIGFSIAGMASDLPIIGILRFATDENEVIENGTNQSKARRGLFSCPDAP